MNELTQQFYNLETLLLKPEVRSSREELGKLLADDFVEFGSSGSVYRKSDTLASLTTTTDKVVYEVSDFEAKGKKNRAGLCGAGAVLCIMWDDVRTFMLI